MPRFLRKWLSPLPRMIFLSHASKWDIINKDLSYHPGLTPVKKLGSGLKSFLWAWPQSTPQKAVQMSEITFAPGNDKNYGSKSKLIPYCKSTDLIMWMLPEFTKQWECSQSRLSKFNLGLLLFPQVSQSSLDTIKKTALKEILHNGMPFSESIW